MTARPWIIGLGGALVAACVLIGWQRQQRVRLGQPVPAAERRPLSAIEHGAWNKLLARYVNDAGLVDYRGWLATPADVAALDGYLAELAHGDLHQNGPRAAELAFWINAYNAVTVRGILREYPTSSIRNHTPRWWGYHIWYHLLLPVGAEWVSLDAIEHRRLRPLGDPRIHFALVCAARGCPRLLNQAYHQATLDEQLDANARAFFADPTKFRADVPRGRLEMSWILDYFARDFGPDTAAVLRRIAPFLPDDASRDLATSGRAQVSYLPYDWTLNEADPARSE